MFRTKSKKWVTGKLLPGLLQNLNLYILNSLSPFQFTPKLHRIVINYFVVSRISKKSSIVSRVLVPLY